VKAKLHSLVNSWGHFPTLDYSEVLSYLGEHTYNLKAAQRIIENHLWGDEVAADVKVKFVEISNPGRIQLIQSWTSGKIELDMTIEVAERYRNHPAAQMAILAHEYAHAFHYLRDDFTPPSDGMEYENLTDLSTVALGMGELMLRGRIVKENPKRVMIIGYLPGDLLSDAQFMYQKMKKKYPSSSSMPHATIRPGKETTWEHEEPRYPKERTPKPKKSSAKKELNWKKDLLVAIIPHSGKAIPLGQKTILGREFAKENFPHGKTSSKISREQIHLEMDDGVLLIKNLGKNPVKVERKQVISIFNIRLWDIKSYDHLRKGEEIKITSPPVKIYFPESGFFTIT
jgi:hypothetical protein